jgi:hypothetical protein
MLRSPLSIAIAIPLALGCSTAAQDDEEPTTLEARVLVGQVDDSDIVLGVVAEGDALTVYACGGTQTFATHTRWFQGSFGEGDDPDAFEIEQDGFSLQGRRTPDGLSGVLHEPDGSMRTIAAFPTAEDTLSGLYFATVDGCRTGVVLFATPDGVDGQGTYCNDQGEFIQVIILQPVQLRADGIEVEVEKDEGAMSFFVEPA